MCRLFPHHIATASRSRSTWGSPLMSIAARLIVPPLKGWGWVREVIGNWLSTMSSYQRPSPRWCTSLAGLDATLAHLLVAMEQRMAESLHWLSRLGMTRFSLLNGSSTLERVVHRDRRRTRDTDRKRPARPWGFPQKSLDLFCGFPLINNHELRAPVTIR